MKNKVGLSSGCYYPRLPETVIKDISDSGVSVMELFINTHSEMKTEYITEIKRIADYYGVSVCSVHPFSSFAETYLFFSDYSRRMLDGLEIYDRYFEICNLLGSGILNFHGMYSEKNVPFEKYCHVYSVLFERAKKAGIVFSQENVRRHVCGNIDYIRRFSDALGDDVSFTLDIKQAHMAGFDPISFSDVVAKKLCLVHLNDFNDDNPCLLPGKGSFDIKSFMNRLISNGYTGNFIIEVYSNNYNNESEIKESVSHVKSIFKECIV